MSLTERRPLIALTILLCVAACSDAPTTPTAPVPGSVQSSAAKYWEVGSSVGWNRTARDLIAARGGGTPNTQARTLVYLSLAQYDAIVAAEDTKDRGDHASPAAAAAAASLVVLESFFPLDVPFLRATFLAQKASPPWPGEQHDSFAAGEAVGRSIGAAVLAYAATDRVGLTVPPPNPGGPGNWTGTNSLRGFYGARTFALTSGDQFRPGPPPAFHSPEFDAALAQVRAFSDDPTPAHLAIARFWAPNGPGYMNAVAAEMAVAHHRSERDAARILALANMAGFDVLNACFDAKFAYYLIRPSQVDPLIALPVGLPNHPSYPSGHSCITSAYATVLANAFPDERDRLDAMVEEAGWARIYAGLHYRFDVVAGRELGRRVGEWVLRVAPNGHDAIPLD
jgi:membrane-associated phospholipid phosphatase